MENAAVIVRAFRGRPVHRVAVKTSDRLVYVCPQDRLEAVEQGNAEPLGVPIEDVFAFETSSYKTLRAELERTGSTDSKTWTRLCRVRNLSTD